MRRVAFFTFAVSASILVYAVSREPARPRSPAKNELANGLQLDNGVFQDLAARSLTSTAIENNADVLLFLSLNPGFFKYMIECALPEGAMVMVDDGMQTHSFAGAVGLAPDWATGPCDVACQEWVTACLLARTNRYEIPVRIFITGDHQALGGDNEDPNFLVDEGAFYGNLFVDPPRLYTCRGGGNDPLYLSVRVCTLPGNLCGYQALGPCGQVDGNNGLPSKRHACEAYEDGIYRRCHNVLSIEDSDEFPQPNRVYDRTLNIKVRKSTFSGGVGASCLGGAPDGGVSDPPDSGVGEPVLGETAGRRCAFDEDCRSNVLTCDVRGPQPSCTATCTDSPNQAVEQAQCGGGRLSTCLSDHAFTNICTRACAAGRPSEAMGGCPPNRVCTGLWLSSATGVPDRTGCYPHCQVDGDCSLGTFCHTRIGACLDVPPDLTKKRDGEPCSTQEECRGGCIQTSTTPGETGQCFSAINLAETGDCPDDPATMFGIFANRDDLAVCVIRECSTSDQCTPPLVCRRSAITQRNGCIPPR